jgi:hypothetical protein
LLVASVVSMVALTPSRRDSGGAAWMISDRGSGDPEAADSLIVVVVVYE